VHCRLMMLFIDRVLTPFSPDAVWGRGGSGPLGSGPCAPPPSVAVGCAPVHRLADYGAFPGSVLHLSPGGMPGGWIPEVIDGERYDK